jgi:hypothetical protein
LTLLSQWKWNFVHELAPWLSGVIESKLGGCQWHCWVKTQRCQWQGIHRRVNFRNFVRLSLHLKRKSNQIQERVNYTTQDLGGKSLKNRGYIRKLFWLSGVIHCWVNFKFESLGKYAVAYLQKVLVCETVA